MSRKRIYDWEGWFGGGGKTVIHRGVDYQCSQSAMTNMVRTNASRRGLRVRVIDGDVLIIIEVVGEISHPNETTVAV